MMPHVKGNEGYVYIGSAMFNNSEAGALISGGSEFLNYLFAELCK